MRKKCPLTSVQPLPGDFADRVLKLEISVDVECSIDSLRALLELYSVIYIKQAIEFYESIHDLKYKYYQDRMMEVLQKQNNMLLKSKEEEPQHKPPAHHSLAEKRQADFTIKQNENDTRLVTRQVSMDLLNQNMSFMSRFNSRKSRNISVEPKKKLAKYKETLENMHKRRSSEGECDRSAGLSITREAEALERELEEIMEKSVMEKIEKTSEIKKKYNEEIQEIQKMGSGQLITQLVDQMKFAMNKELQELDIYLEEKRKVAIHKIRDFIYTKNK